MVVSWFSLSYRLSARSSVQESSVVCVTGSSNRTSEHRVTLHYSNSPRHLHDMPYRYTPDPNITNAAPAKSFLG